MKRICIFILAFFLITGIFSSAAADGNGIKREETDSLLSLYIPKTIRAKEQTTQLDHMNEDSVNYLTYGLLMDWDNDGTKELFLSYLQPHSWYGTRKVGIYDIQSGEVTVIAEDLNTGVDYACAGLYGLTGITMFQGAPAVFACEYGENTSPFSEDVYQTIWVSFTLWDINSQRVLHEAEISCDGYSLSYRIDETACSEADFYALIDGCSFLTYDSAPPTVQLIYDAELLSVDDLLNAMQIRTIQSDTVENIPSKQPTQIRRIETTGDVFAVSLQFDSDGRLTSSKNSGGYSETYTYDEAGRLIVVNNSVWKSIGPMYEYHYDENGYLVEISGIGEGGGAALSLENDQNGRVIREISESDFGTTITEYSYNEDGSHADVCITNTSEYLPPIEYATYEYEFDNQGRILSEAFTSERYSYRNIYNYDYPPFTLICDENGTPYRCEITDCVGRTIWSIEIWDGFQTIACDDDGYLSEIICDEATFRFLFSDGDDPNCTLERNETALAKTAGASDHNMTNRTATAQRTVGYVANTENGLNVREDPSTSAEIVRRIRNGTRVTITEQVTIDGMLWGRISDGWICMNYIKLEEDESSRGVRYIVSPSAGLVNIRCEAGTAYESIERISGGEEVIIYEQKADDGRVWGKTDTGWICMDYLTRSP